VAATESAGRERILSRIRTALATPAPKHPNPTPGAPIFAPVGDALARFQKECADNITECVLTDDSQSTAAALRAVLEAVSPGEIYIQESPLLRRITDDAALSRPIRWSSEGAPSEASQATVTLADSLIASTGSILVGSSNGGRGASVVAPVHVVIASQPQLAPDLGTGFTRASQHGLPGRNSCLCLITGSSRTADIEKILVLGAHGPRRLVVILAQRLD
jgi:L-lactate dehydrogenase complex protein LldG